jgi:hypothetical protein
LTFGAEPVGVGEAMGVVCGPAEGDGSGLAEAFAPSAEPGVGTAEWGADAQPTAIAKHALTAVANRSPRKTMPAALRQFLLLPPKAPPPPSAEGT